MFQTFVQLANGVGGVRPHQPLIDDADDGRAELLGDPGDRDRRRDLALRDAAADPGFDVALATPSGLMKSFQSPPESCPELFLFDGSEILNPKR